MIVGRDFFQRVEILGHEHELHHVLRRRTAHGLGKILNRIFQAGDDGFALIGDAFSLQALRFRLGFGLLHQQHLIGFGARNGRFPFALRSVDVVHGRLHLQVRHDVGDQHFDDRVAVLLHRAVEIVPQVGRDVGLIEESVVQLHFRNVAEDHVVNHGFDLLHGIGQFVERRLDSVRHHFVLDGDRNLHEYVVLSFRFNLYVELLDLHAHARNHGFDQRRLPIETGTCDAGEFSQALHDGHLRSLNGEERAEHYHQDKNKDGEPQE